MPFNPTFLSKIPVKSIYEQYVYKTDDTLAEALSDGYFTGARFSTTTGTNPIIEIEATDGDTITRVDLSTFNAIGLPQKNIEDIAGTVNGLVEVTTLSRFSTYTNGDTLSQGDSGNWIAFDDASEATLNIGDGLDIGTSVLLVNIGGGGVTTSFNTETLRGSGTLSDVDGYMAITKITATAWQSSERV